MPKFQLAIDVHDGERLALVSTANCPGMNTSQGALLRRLLYHLQAFESQVLPQLQIPPVEGDTALFCFNVSDEERYAMRQLAGKLHASVTDFWRALLLYHWDLWQAYMESLPGLGYVEANEKSHVRLAFAPDRLQPWYSFSIEHKARMEEHATETRGYWIAEMEKQGRSQEEIEQFISQVQRAKEVRDNFQWDEEVKSPAQIQSEEREADNLAGSSWRQTEPPLVEPTFGDRLEAFSCLAVMLLVGGGAVWLIATYVLPSLPTWLASLQNIPGIR